MSTVSKMLKDILSWYFTGDYNYPISKTKNGIMISVLLAFVSPFCLQSNSLSALRHIGTVSFFTSATLAVSMIVLGLKRIVRGEGDDDFENDDVTHTTAVVWDCKQILSGSAALCFAYSSVANIAGVVHEMRPKPKTVFQAHHPVLWSTALCCILYLGVGLICSLAWGSKVATGSGNVLYLIHADNVWITFWSFVLVISIVLLFPVINYPILKEMETVLTIVLGSDDLNKSSNPFLVHRKTLMCLVIFILTVVVDSCVDDLASLFGLCASMGLSVVSLILPSLMYLATRTASSSCLHCVGAILVLLLGIMVMVGSTATIIMGMV